jgi:hypothetical protein
MGLAAGADVPGRRVEALFALTGRGGEGGDVGVATAVRGQFRS